jgi:hypothetical protein
MLRVENGANVSTVAIGNVELALPSGLLLELKDVYFIPCISRNIVSISLLDLDGYHFAFKNKCCSFFINDIYFGSANLLNGLYILDIERPV